MGIKFTSLHFQVMNILVPFVVLMILVFTIRAVSLPGASYGMKYLFYPGMWPILCNLNFMQFKLFFVSCGVSF